MSEISLNTVNVSEKGQIAIPQEIRTLLGIKKGDRLVLATKNQKILIQKATNLSKQIDDDFDDLLGYSEITLKKVWSNKKDDIWSKYLK